MQPYTLTASKITDEMKGKPYQVKISITFHDDQFYEKMFEFSQKKPRLFVVPRERFQQAIGTNKERKYAFDAVYQKAKFKYTDQTLLDFFTEGEWLYSFDELQMQEEFLEEGINELDRFLLKANSLVEGKRSIDNEKQSRTPADRRWRRLRWFVYIGGFGGMLAVAYILDSRPDLASYIHQNHLWFPILLLILLSTMLVLIPLMEIRISRGSLDKKTVVTTTGVILGLLTFFSLANFL
ncbi:hypothetical protein [Geomicrobium sp. JCM 19055]|uniref:hypothetical protein n=1 Tax=Geomicrobium sp. JCM 19055 TaxID=1460649 RepID=UPI00045ED2D1|nr:hypothetical protein [Geomicrobium sp. JCM 19055]GAJ98082.1 hypothetical protein JCM19055_984 [Geomicrobium sp. JCM 19055]